MSTVSDFLKDIWQKAELNNSVIDRYTLVDRAYTNPTLPDTIIRSSTTGSKLIVRKLCLRANVLDDDCFMLIFKTIKSQTLSGLASAGGVTLGSSTSGNTILGVDPAGPGGLDYIGFVFPLNPNKFEKQQKKLVNWVLGAGGYTAQVWGNAVIPIICSGTTGRINPEDELNEGELLILNTLPTDFERRSYLDSLGKGGLKDTITWRAFRQLQYYFQYYNGGNEINLVDTAMPSRLTEVFLLTTDKLYKGLLTELNWGDDANDPWQVKYNFKFEAYPVLESPIEFSDVAV